jgi:hypothetical protein
MLMKEYFTKATGTGVLATADAKGSVDIALYARPYVIDAKTVAFVMSDRRSRANLSANPKCAYLFVEEKQGYAGKRLYLTRTKEETDPARVKQLREEYAKEFGRAYCPADETGTAAIVYFRVDSIRALVGDAEEKP